MSGSIKQEATPAFSNSSGTVITNALTGTTAGNVLEADFGGPDGGGLAINSIVDTQGNTWTAYAMVADSNQFTYWKLVAENIKGGAGVNTLTVTTNILTGYRMLAFREIQGVVGLDTNPATANFQASGNTGANAVTTNSQTNLAHPAFLSYFALSLFGSGTTLVATTGPGLSSQAVGTSGVCASGSTRVLSNGANAATFTQSAPAATFASITIYDEGAPTTNVLTAATGNYTLTGEPAARDLALPAAEGAFTLTGFAISTPTYVFAAAIGRFGITGVGAVLTWLQGVLVGVIAPPPDTAGIILQAQVATVQAIANESSTNPMVLSQAQQLLNQLQVELVDHFMVTGWLNAATILGTPAVANDILTESGAYEAAESGVRIAADAGGTLAVGYGPPAWDKTGQMLLAGIANTQALVNATAPTSPVLSNYQQLLYQQQRELVDYVMALPGGTSAATILATMTGFQSFPFEYTFTSVGFTDQEIDD